MINTKYLLMTDKLKHVYSHLSGESSQAGKTWLHPIILVRILKLHTKFVLKNSDNVCALKITLIYNTDNKQYTYYSF